MTTFRHSFQSFILQLLGISRDFKLFWEAWIKSPRTSPRACICYFSFFHQMIVFKVLWKMLFISSKKLFSSSRYSHFCYFSLSFPLLNINWTFSFLPNLFLWTRLWINKWSLKLILGCKTCSQNFLFQRTITWKIFII